MSRLRLERTLGEAIGETGSWGGWHDKVTARDLLGVPVRFAPSWGMSRAEHDDAAARIACTLDLLRTHEPAAPQDLGLFEKQAGRAGDDHVNALRTLDDAIFDLFELSQAQRDLVEDFWAEGHDLYWRGGDVDRDQAPAGVQ